MTCFVLVACLLSLPDIHIESGYLSAYAELPTVATLAYRQEVGDIPQDISQYDALIAVADCSLIGREALLYTEIGTMTAIIYDCAGNDGTPTWMAENRIVAEVDYWTWQRHPEIVGGAAILSVHSQ